MLINDLIKQMELNNLTKEKIIDYISSDKVNSLHPSDEIQNWMDTDPDNHSLLKIFNKIWVQSGIIGKDMRFDAESRWAVIDSEIKRNNKRSVKIRRLWITSASVAVSILLLFSVKFLMLDSKSTYDAINIVTNSGDRSTTTLPDGSKVILNGGSELSYSLIDGNRVATLSGEALFDVSHSNIPFIVKLSSADHSVIVHGTRFSISAYDDDEFISTSLISGSVSLATEGLNEQTLKPGEMSLFNKKEHRLDITDVSIEEMSGWLDKKLYMDNINLSNLTKKLERWYGVSISIDPNLEQKGLIYTGVIQENSIDGVLEALTMISNIDYTKDQDQNQYNLYLRVN